MSSYAADMIRRFREEDPTSRDVRQKKRDTGEIKQMWWVDENETENVRRSRPEPQQRRDDPPRDSYNGGRGGGNGNGRRLLGDSMDSMGRSVDVDDLIAKEIRQLEVEQTHGGRNFGATTGSFDMRRSDDNVGIGNKLDAPTYRYGGTRDPLADLRSSGDFFRSSQDTLGSTGIKALLMPDFRLDGKNDADFQQTSDENGDEAPGMSRQPSATDMQIKSNLEDILKELDEAKAAREASGYGIATNSSSISAITAQLASDMQGLLAPLRQREQALKEKEADEKRRDDQMREQGRKLEREKALMGEDSSKDRGPLDYVGATMMKGFMSGPTSSAPVSSPVKLGSAASATAVKAGTTTSPLRSPAPTSATATTTFTVKPVPSQVGRTGMPRANYISSFDGLMSDPSAFAQRLADAEVKQADALFNRMRSLRGDLGQRTRALDVVYASVMDGTMPPQRSMDILNTLNSQRSHIGSSSGNGGNPYLGSNYPDSEDVAPTPSPRWNPYPELVHKNILGTAEGIASMLDVAMNTLAIRLPEEEPEPAQEDVEFSILNQESAAAETTTMPHAEYTELDNRTANLTPAPAPSISGAGSGSSAIIEATGGISVGTDTAVDTATIVAREASKMLKSVTRNAMSHAAESLGAAYPYDDVHVPPAHLSLEPIVAQGHATTPPFSPKRREPTPEEMAQEQETLAEIDLALGSEGIDGQFRVGLARFVPPPARAPQPSSMTKPSNSTEQLPSESHFNKPGMYRYTPGGSGLNVHSFMPHTIQGPSSRSAQPSSFQASAPPQSLMPQYKAPVGHQVVTIPNYKPKPLPNYVPSYDHYETFAPPTEITHPRPVEGSAYHQLQRARTFSTTSAASSSAATTTRARQFVVTQPMVAPGTAGYNSYSTHHSADLQTPAARSPFVPNPVESGDTPSARRQYLSQMQNMREMLSVN